MTFYRRAAMLVFALALGAMLTPTADLLARGRRGQRQRVRGRQQIRSPHRCQRPRRILRVAAVHPVVAPVYRPSFYAAPLAIAAPVYRPSFYAAPLTIAAPVYQPQLGYGYGLAAVGYGGGYALGLGGGCPLAFGY